MGSSSALEECSDEPREQACLRPKGAKYIERKEEKNIFNSGCYPISHIHAGRGFSQYDLMT